MPALNIDIEARFAKFQDGLDQMVRNSGKAASSINHAFEGVKHTLEAIGVGLSVAEIVKFFGEARDAAVEFETSAKRLDAIFKNIGDAAGVSKGEIEEFAEGLSKSTQFRADDLRNAASEILKFGKIHGDTFKEALQVSADLAAFMGTNVTEAAEQVAKALADPERATRLLKQAGVVLNEEQKEQLKHMLAIGDTAGAQTVVLEKLKAAYGGVAETMNTGLIKATTGLSKAWHEMLEEIGKSKAASDEGFFGFLTHSIEAAREALKDFNHERENTAQNAGAASTKGRIVPFGETPDSRINDLNNLIANAPPPKRSTADDDAAFAKERINQLARQKLAQINFQIIKDSTIETQKILDSFHSNAQISDEEFFNDRIALIKKSMDAEIKALDAGFAAQQLIITKTGKSPEEIAGAQVEAVKIDAQRDKVRRDAGLAQFQLTQQNSIAEREFNKELLNTAATTLTLQHNLAAATALKVFDPNNDQRRKLNIEAQSPDTERAAAAKSALEQLDAQGKLLVSKAALSDEELRFSQILDDVSIKQQHIEIDASAGAITEIESLVRLSKVNKDRIEDLTIILQRYEEIARTTGDPADLLRAEKLRLEIHKLSSETDLLAKKFNDAFAGSLADTLTNLADGTITLKDAFSSLTKSILHDINSILSKNFAESLFGKGGDASGAGGFFADLFKGGTGSGLIGIAKGLFNTKAVGNPGTGEGDFLGAFATGTDFVPRTGLALIHRGERIIPAEKNTMGGASGATVNMTVVTPDAGSFRRSRSQVAGDMYTALAVAQRNR